MRGNLVLCRNEYQSVFVGEGDHEVKVTVIDTVGRGTLSFDTKGDVKIIRDKHDNRIVNIDLAGEPVSVTNVSCNGRTVKLAFEAERHVSIDREEIRSSKTK